MAHFKTDVIKTRKEALRYLTTQRDIFAGAIANLNKTIEQIDGCKKMLLMVAVDSDTLTDVSPMDLAQELEVPATGG